MSGKIDKVLSKPKIRERAGDTYYRRGEGYFEDGRVGKLEPGEDYVAASVSGSHRYRVKLCNIGGALRGSCNCPLGQDREFCKHQVAVGLAYLASRDGKKDKTGKVFDWGKFIRNCSREELEKIVLEMTPRCPEIVEKHRMSNLPDNPEQLLNELKNKIDSLVELAENCGYRDDYYYDYDDDDDTDYGAEFDTGCGQLFAALKKLAAKKDFALLFELAEYGIENIRKCSTIEEETVAEFLDTMLGFYCSAARKNVKPPEYLVGKIESWEQYADGGSIEDLNARFEDFPRAVQDLWYERARQRWEKLPPLKMGAKQSDYQRSQLESRLLWMADAKNDMELSLKIRLNNLSRDHDILKLAEYYQKGGKQERILPLLKEAREHFPDSVQIRNALAGEQQRLGDHDGAMKLAWREFEKNPFSGETYQFLMKLAQSAKHEDEYFDKVQDFLAKQEQKEAKSRNPWQCNSSRMRRIEILFDAKRYEQAWELGRDAECGEHLKLRLAKWRGKEHPADAADIYAALLEKAMGTTGNSAYEHTAGLLKEYQKYLRAAGQGAKYDAYSQWLRNEYKRRRNLIALMNQHHL